MGSDVIRVFEIYHRLLAVCEPYEAVIWLVNPQDRLQGRKPCELLETHEGYVEIINLIDDLRESAQ